MIEKMASDLGVFQFEEESMLQFKARVVYSALACWMKAISLDAPVGYAKNDLVGVSRRYIYERGHDVFDKLMEMFPELSEWFEVDSGNEDPITVIRKRLIYHGDLLNAGFNTNLALSSVEYEQITTSLETIYGKTLDNGMFYSGIALLRCKETMDFEPRVEDVEDWLKSYIKNAFWTRALPDLNQVQYFDPASNINNNYMAWKDYKALIPDEIVLIRTVQNSNNYSYYLLRPESKLMHVIDPFLQSQGIHIRLMYALRSKSKNQLTARISKYNDHVLVRLNALLPLTESIKIESYMWPKRSINDRTEWVVANSVWELIIPYIEALGILIKEEHHG